MNRIIITGGAGFIGACLVRTLADGGSDVLVYDDLSRGTLAALPKNGNVRFVEGQVEDTEWLDQVVKEFQPKAVCHLAAMHYIPDCERNPTETIKRNVLGTQGVLEVCARYGKIDTLLFASSAAIYSPSSRRMRESSPSRPIDIYGLSKLFGEELVKSYSRERETKCIVARIFNVYGPGDTNPHVIPDLIGQVVEGSSVIEVGNLGTRRDYVYVNDVSDALLTLLSHSCKRASLGSFLGAFNIGTGKDSGISDIVGTLSVICGNRLTVMSKPERMRSVDRARLVADISKIRSVGWVPGIDLEQGIRLTFDAAKRNRQGAALTLKGR